MTDGMERDRFPNPEHRKTLIEFHTILRIEARLTVANALAHSLRLGKLTEEDIDVLAPHLWSPDDVKAEVLAKLAARQQPPLA